MKLQQAIFALSLGFFLTNVCAQSQPFYDPTTPITPDTPVEFIAEGEIILQAIVLSSTRPFAIISNHNVEIGQKIGDFKVVNISKQSVQLQGEGGIVTLSITNPILDINTPIMTIKKSEN